MRFCYLTGLSLLLVRTALGQAAADSTQRATVRSDAWRVSSTTDSTGACVEVLQTGGPRALVRSYHPSGHLHEYVSYLDATRGLRHGVSTTWYDDGQLQAYEPYQNGARQGTMLLYYEDGRLKRQSEYEAGRELPGLCYDAAGQPLAYFPYEQPPLYPGGTEQLLRELGRAMRRARVTNQLAMLLPSYVQISFLIGEDGRVTQPRIEVPSLLPTHDQAALVALGRLSRPWLPGQRDGQRATYAYRLRLPVGRAAEPSALWQY